jgi:Ala-tRNA(Pro) deacylase
MARSLQTAVPIMRHAVSQGQDVRQPVESRLSFLQTWATADHCRGTMPATSTDLFAMFDRLGIEHSTVEHPPFFTVAEGRPWHDKIPGLHGKNLFLKDRKGGLWLVVMPADKRADVGQLEKALGAPRFSFARPDLLHEVLALAPGSVTPFGLINDTQRRVTVILDEEILDSEWVNFHPLHNAASTTLRSSDLLRFIRALGHEPTIVRLPAEPADR